MQFDKFHGTKDRGRRSDFGDKVHHTVVSQGTRSDADDTQAQAHVDGRGDSFLEEYERLRDRFLEVQQQITENYSDAAFTSAQSHVRKQHHGRPNDSIMEWLRLRTRMQVERTALVNELKELECRMGKIKPAAMREKREMYGDPKNSERVELFKQMVTVQNRMLDVLTEIRDLLRSKE